MPHPNAPDDDSWDELARELGIDDISAKIDAVPVEHEPLAEELGEEEAGVVEGEADAGEGEYADDAEGEAADGDAEGSEETTGDDQPGTGRKRRRRRRRRGRGKGAPGEAGGTESAATVGAEAEEEIEPAEAPKVVAAASRRSHDEAEEDLDAEEMETGGVQPAAEEDTGSEVLRELIATWNVPTWDDIVTGLYRPDR